MIVPVVDIAKTLQKRMLIYRIVFAVLTMKTTRLKTGLALKDS
jgi:hypothetical protein